jgi:hypothetical protein
MRRFQTAVIITAALTAAPALLASCGSDRTTVTNRLVPAAQEEADLKRALDAGAITQSEYEEQLEKLRDGD